MDEEGKVRKDARMWTFNGRSCCTFYDCQFEQFFFLLQQLKVKLKVGNFNIT